MEGIGDVLFESGIVGVQDEKVKNGTQRPDEKAKIVLKWVNRKTSRSFIDCLNYEKDPCK